MRKIKKYKFLILMMLSSTIALDAIEYSHDNLNRVTKATYSSGESISYTLDKGGNLLRVVYDDSNLLGLELVSPDTNQTQDTLVIGEDSSGSLSFIVNEQNLLKEDVKTTIVTNPQNGTLTIDNGQLKYIPNDNYTGSDSFVVRVDVNGKVVQQTVNVEVTRGFIYETQEFTNLFTDTKYNVAKSAKYTRGIFTKDMDGDGDIDILSASENDNKIAWHENSGIGNFTEHIITTSANGARDVFALDIDKDGDIDVVAASGSGDKVEWYENDGSQNFTIHLISSDTDIAKSVYALDMDGDGDIDIISASTGDNKIAWFENDGSENFTQNIVTLHANNIDKVVPIDLDDDGDIDLVSSESFDQEIVWYENDGSQNFSSHVIHNPAFSASNVLVIDIDNDKDLDVIYLSASSQIIWCENDGSQNFTTHSIVTISAARKIYAIDIDNDNDIDFVSASSQKVQWHENDGSQVFMSHLVSQTAISQYTTIFADDINNDGDIDIISGGIGYVLWHPNNLNPYIAKDINNTIDINASKTTASINLSIDSKDSNYFNINVVDDGVSTESIKPSVKINPLNGSVSIVDNQIIYTPDTDYSGADSFVILFDNGDGVSIEKTITVEVSAVNDAPVWESIIETRNVLEDANQTVIVLNASDAEGDNIVYTAISSDETLATVALNDNNLTITYLKDMYGQLNIILKASDGNLNSTQIFDVNIEAINDAPTIQNIEDIHLSENFTTKDIKILVNDVDSDSVSVLSLSAVSSDENIVEASTILNDGVVSLTSVVDTNGTVDVRVEVTLDDGDGSTPSYMQTFKVIVKSSTVSIDSGLESVVTSDGNGSTEKTFVKDGTEVKVVEDLQTNLISFIVDVLNSEIISNVIAEAIGTDIVFDANGSSKMTLQGTDYNTTVEVDINGKTTALIEGNQLLEIINDFIGEVNSFITETGGIVERMLIEDKNIELHLTKDGVTKNTVQIGDLKTELQIDLLDTQTTIDSHGNIKTKFVLQSKNIEVGISVNGKINTVIPEAPTMPVPKLLPNGTTMKIEMGNTIKFTGLLPDTLEFE